MFMVTSLHLLSAGVPAARGFPPGQVIPATIVAVLLTAAVAYGAWRYRQGRFAALERVANAAGARSGLRAWAALPGVRTPVSLLVAVFGFYWDVAWHIDKGRDDGPFSTPAHYFIIVGLLGIALAGVLSVVLDKDDQPDGVTMSTGWRVSIGGALLLLCGMIALAGFPLDDLWHTMFGQDVTLWGPTHIQMIGGASLATLGTWMLEEEGRRRNPEGRRAVAGRGGLLGFVVSRSDIIAAGAFLVGLSTLQGEFDFGVPQFRAVYQPILIMLAAGIGLVTARIRAGRGVALGAVVVFLVIRGGLTLLIAPGLGRSVLHFPLYIVEALLVEAAAFVVSTRKQVTFGAVSGLLLGTVGLAAEWGWSHLRMPPPGAAALWPQAAILGFTDVVAGGILGGLAGRALLPEEAPRQRSPRFLVPVAWAAAFTTLALALPMSAPSAKKAPVTLKDAGDGPQRSVLATVKLAPPQAADNAAWFNITSWQGGTGTYNSTLTGQWVVPLRPVAGQPGTFRTPTPVPVYGKWKTLLRLPTARRPQGPPGLPVSPPPRPPPPGKGGAGEPAVHAAVRAGQEDPATRGRRRIAGSPAGGVH